MIFCGCPGDLACCCEVFVVWEPPAVEFWVDGGFDESRWPLVWAPF
jgi:hypothetical protein